MATEQEKRLNIYRESSDIVKELYGSPESGRIIWDAEKKLGIKDEETSTIFALAIGDVILGLYKKDTLLQLFKDRLQWDDSKAQTAVTALKPLLDKIPDSPTVSEKPLVFDPSTQPENKDPISIKAPEEDDSSVKPIRTFAMDVDYSRAHGYGSFKSEDSDNGEEKEDDTPTHSSSQDDIIKK